MNDLAVLKVETQGAARVLTVDRPSSRNAINRAVAQRLVDELERVADDQAVHAVVVASSDIDGDLDVLDGEVFTWGDGESGQLGVGDAETASTPTLVRPSRGPCAR